MLVIILILIIAVVLLIGIIDLRCHPVAPLAHLPTPTRPTRFPPSVQFHVLPFVVE